MNGSRDFFYNQDILFSNVNRRWIEMCNPTGAPNQILHEIRNAHLVFVWSQAKQLQDVVVQVANQQ